MLVKVVVKHDESAEWSSSSEIYSCHTHNAGTEQDPIEAGALFNEDAELPLKIGTWQTWQEFNTNVIDLSTPPSANVPVEFTLMTFPEFSDTPHSMMINQARGARAFLSAVLELVPLLRDDLKGVWVRVE